MDASPATPPRGGTSVRATSVRETPSRAAADRPRQRRGVVVAFGAAAIISVGAGYQAGAALNGSKGWGQEWPLSDGVTGVIANSIGPKRDAIRLGPDGDVVLMSPTASGVVVSSRDAIAALSSDHALADAAYLPDMSVNTIGVPIEEPRSRDRVAALTEADILAQEQLDASRATSYDAEIAAALNVAFLEGVDRSTAPNAERELNCLAEAIYFEARGESLEGQAAVAEVVLNRVDSKYWPDTVCGVVNQGSERRTGCQFSYTCDGLPETVTSENSWEVAERIADLMLRGAPRRITKHATHYHADYVSPRWARSMEETTVVGRHIFYRRLIRFAKRDESE